MISKHVRPTDDERTHRGAREDIDRNEARRAAERDAQAEHDRRLERESGTPYVVPNGIDRRTDDA